MLEALLLGDDVPDAGEPVGHQEKAEHEKGQDHGAVLRVTIHLLKEPHEPQKPRELDKVNLTGAGFLN